MIKYNQHTLQNNTHEYRLNKTYLMLYYAVYIGI